MHIYILNIVDRKGELEWGIFVLDAKDFGEGMRGGGSTHQTSTTYWYALYTFLKKFLDIIRLIELLDKGRRHIKSICQKKSESHHSDTFHDNNGICLSYPIGLETTISTWGSALDSRIMLYTSFLVAPGNDFPFHCNTSSPATKMANIHSDDPAWWSFLHFWQRLNKEKKRCSPRIIALLSQTEIIIIFTILCMETIDTAARKYIFLSK